MASAHYHRLKHHENTFTNFFNSPPLSVAQVVFGMLALVLAIIEFGNALG